MNHIKLLFFATIRDKVGVKSVEIDLPENITVKGLKDKLSTDYPSLKDSMRSVLVAVNHEYAFDDALVPQNAEIALFPPVSGG
jgi:molybdopterin converting factor subunit 1